VVGALQLQNLWRVCNVRGKMWKGSQQKVQYKTLEVRGDVRSFWCEEAQVTVNRNNGPVNSSTKEEVSPRVEERRGCRDVVSWYRM